MSLGIEEKKLTAVDSISASDYFRVLVNNKSRRILKSKVVFEIANILGLRAELDNLVTQAELETALLNSPDVIFTENYSSLILIAGESNKLYIINNEQTVGGVTYAKYAQFKWNGSNYVPITNSAQNQCPNDGKKYVGKNKSWVQEGSGLTDGKGVFSLLGQLFSGWFSQDYIIDNDALTYATNNVSQVNVGIGVDATLHCIISSSPNNEAGGSALGLLDVNGVKKAALFRIDNTQGIPVPTLIQVPAYLAMQSDLDALAAQMADISSSITVEKHLSVIPPFSDVNGVLTGTTRYLICDDGTSVNGTVYAKSTNTAYNLVQGAVNGVWTMTPIGISDAVKTNSPKTLYLLAERIKIRSVFNAELSDEDQEIGVYATSINHSLNSSDVKLTIRDSSGYERTNEQPWRVVDENNISIEWADTLTETMSITIDTI